MPKVTTVFGKRLLVVANLCLPFRSVPSLSARFTSKANLTQAQFHVVFSWLRKIQLAHRSQWLQDKAC
jgi:hypothetical protein